MTNQFPYISIVLKQFTPKPYLEALSARLFNFVLDFVTSLPKEKKNLILAVKGTLAVAVGDKEVATLLEWFEGKNEKLKDLELGADLEWNIVSLVNKSQGFDRSVKDAVFKKQFEKDQTDTRNQMSELIKGYNIPKEEREAAWNSYLDKDNKLSVRLMEYSMRGFNNPKRSEELKGFNQRWFTDVITAFGISKDFGKAFYNDLYPHREDIKEFIEELRVLKTKVPEGEHILARSINESIDDESRRLRAYACFEATAKLAKK